MAYGRKGKFSKRFKKGFKTRRNRFAKKRTARRATVRNRTTVKAGLGFPKKMVMTHRYAEKLDVTSTLGAIQKHQFSANGLFDPNITGTGHQPLYFDQMTALYNHYTVIGSKIRVTATPAAANEDATLVGIYIDDDTNTSNVTGISVLQEQSTGSVKVLSAAAVRPVVLYKKWSAKKMFGGSVLGNDNLQGTTSSNPAEQSYYTLAVQSNSADSVTVFFNVEISYIAVWDELKDIAQS